VTKSSALSASKLRALFFELLVVFIGLLAALQVDQWQDRRAFAKAEVRYLERLDSELTEFLQTMNWMQGFVQRNLDGVTAVHEALAAGVLDPERAAVFEVGLLRVAHLPSISVPRSTYDEMVASGSLARLKSEELKKGLSEFYTLDTMTKENFNWWRTGAMQTARELSHHVSFHIVEKSEDENGRTRYKQGVNFDFDALQGNLVIRNGFFWAVDTHDDWKRFLTELVELAEESRASIRAELN